MNSVPSYWWYDLRSRSESVTGYTSTCSASEGPPVSRARSADTAARLPPALSPATTSGRPSASDEATQSTASYASSAAAGNTCSGASR